MENKDENNLSQGQAESFGLPDAYFQKSAQSILNKIEWEEEHTAFEVLKKIRRQHGFNAPQNYFNRNFYITELTDYPLLAQMSRQQGFDFPNNYFKAFQNSLEERLLSQTKVDVNDLKILNTVEKKNVFLVPDNYFSESKNSINKTILVRETRVIRLFPKRVSIAIAAMLFLVLCIWMYNLYSGSVGKSDCGTIACLDKQDLTKTKNLETLEDEELFDLVDPHVLEKKLQMNKKNPTAEQATDSSEQIEDLEEFMDDL